MRFMNRYRHEASNRGVCWRANSRRVGITRSAAGPLFALLLALAPMALAQQDYSKVEVTSTPLRSGTHLLTGAGGNMVASTGADGTFLVDDQYGPLNTKIVAALSKLGRMPLRFVINTHWHGDHTGGNEAFGTSGAVIAATPTAQWDEDWGKGFIKPAQFVGFVYDSLPAGKRPHAH